MTKPSRGQAISSSRDCRVASLLAMTERVFEQFPNIEELAEFFYKIMGRVEIAQKVHINHFVIAGFTGARQFFDEEITSLLRSS